MTRQPWTSVDVSVVLPMAEARAVFERAERFDIETGGRFDRRSAYVLIWPVDDRGRAGLAPHGLARPQEGKERKGRKVGRAE